MVFFLVWIPPIPLSLLNFFPTFHGLYYGSLIIILKFKKITTHLKTNLESLTYGFKRLVEQK